MGRTRKSGVDAGRGKPSEGDQVLWALGEQQKLLSELRDFAVKFADANPDNPAAQMFVTEARKASSALSDAKHAFRQALGLTYVEAREGAERELAQHSKAMRPDVG